jgi:hypothetical protein
MPCNCQKKPEDYPQNKEWGPLFWTVLHCLAEKAGQAQPIFQIEELNAWLILLKQLQFIIPCTDCRAHYVAYYTNNPLSKKDILKNVRIWLFNLHNSINIRNNSPVFALEDLSKTYPSDLIKANLIGLTIKLGVVIKLSGVKLNDWNQWYSKAMQLKSYYNI